MTFSHVISQGRSSTKIVGDGATCQINVGHHGWPTEKILGFEWAKTTQLALKSLRFFLNIFNYVQSFTCLSKIFWRVLCFLQGYFFVKIQKFKKGSVQNETMYTL